MDTNATPAVPILDPRHRPLVAAARRATLATTAPDGRPRLVPVCFVLSATDDILGRPVIHTPLDEKPKRARDPRTLARVRDVLAVPQATLLVDRWDEDWRMLGWVRLYGSATLLEPAPADGEERARGHRPADGPGVERASAIRALREKYPQYESHRLETLPMIRLAIERVVAWGATG